MARKEQAPHGLVWFCPQGLPGEAMVFIPASRKYYTKKAMGCQRCGAIASNADQYFAEIAVRLHREGEGAAYTGLKDEQVPTAIVEADNAMQSGNLKSVYSYLDGANKHGVEEKYRAVVEAREHAKKLGTVKAQLEAVEAELTFEKYIYELYTIASAAAPMRRVRTHTKKRLQGGSISE